MIINKKTIITIFNKDCDICQYSLNEIKEKVYGKIDFNFIFISNIDEATYHYLKDELMLLSISNSYLLYDVNNELFDLLRIRHVPTFILFDEKGKIINTIENIEDLLIEVNNN